MGAPSQITTIGPEILRISTRRKPTTAAALYESGRTCMNKRPSGVIPLMKDQMIARQLDPQHRRLPAWRPGAHCHRQQIKARFVYPDDGCLVLLGFFLMAVPRSLRPPSHAPPLSSVHPPPPLPPPPPPPP